MSELRRYLDHFRPHGSALMAATVLMGMAAVIPGAAVVVLERALDAVLVQQDRAVLGRLALAFAFLFVANGALRIVRTRITKGIAWQVASDLRRQLHRKYLQLTPTQQGTTGERISALTHDVDEVQYGVSAIVTALRNPVTLLVLSITAWMMSPELAMVALVGVPLVLAPTWLAGRLVRRRGSDVRAARSAMIRLMQDQLAGLDTVQTFGAEDREAERFAVRAEVDRLARLRLEVDRVLPSAVVQAVAAAGVGVMLWVGGQRVLDGTLTPGALVGFALSIGLMVRPLGQLSEVWSLLQRSLGALERVYATLDLLPAVEEAAIQATLPPGPLAIAWRRVSVDYGEGIVLEKLELVARAGEMLAIVGPTGAGKSTLLKLVNRRFDPDVGEVRLGGVDIANVALGTLREAVAVVPQADFLFARTVAENVRFGSPGATDAEIRAALAHAGVLDVVEGLPGGIDTPLDELGRRLSGGERQRICLARALITQARVLLLDEATNQVDSHTEAEILRVLGEMKAGRTLIVVAHDLAAARHADRIAFLEDGRVVESGTHHTLMTKGGRYAALWDAQRTGDAA